MYVNTAASDAGDGMRGGNIMAPLPMIDKSGDDARPSQSLSLPMPNKCWTFRIPIAKQHPACDQKEDSPSNLIAVSFRAQTLGLGGGRYLRGYSRGPNKP